MIVGLALLLDGLAGRGLVLEKRIDLNFRLEQADRVIFLKFNVKTRFIEEPLWTQ
ncbi:MAG: hypothetical protein MUF49_27175 [Oculatellaceae cyanobacterium Prado106]|jgi:hypothetical protein|nr:hypothetical protein [Oculatellaceae cyanobacterium Prado106]